MGDGRGSAVLSTYRYLRLATVLLVLALAVGVLAATLAEGCVRSSISAYYFTSARNVFVAVLCALGVCLIVYKGSSETEDVLLNFAGFLAFVVAVVPTARPSSCGPATATAIGAGLTSAMRNGVWVIAVTGVLAQVSALVLSRREGATRPTARWARWAYAAGWTVVACGMAGFVFFPDSFAAHGHTIAAVALFAGIIAVAVVSAISASWRPDGQAYVRGYRAIAVAMFATLVAVVVVHLAFPGWGHLVLVAESLLIAEFAAFWTVQTVELWNVVDRTDLYEAGVAPETL